MSDYKLRTSSMSNVALPVGGALEMEILRVGDVCQYLLSVSFFRFPQSVERDLRMKQGVLGHRDTLILDKNSCSFWPIFVAPTITLKIGVALKIEKSAVKVSFYVKFLKIHQWTVGHHLRVALLMATLRLSNMSLSEEQRLGNQWSISGFAAANTVGIMDRLFCHLSLAISTIEREACTGEGCNDVSFAKYVEKRNKYHHL